MNFVLLPAHQNETVLGYTMRTCKASGFQSLKLAAQHFFNLTAIQPPLFLPSNLDIFSERCKNVLGNASNIVACHTVAPALIPFLSQVAREELLAHLKGTAGSKNPFMYLGFSNASTKPKLHQLFCLDCATEDIHQVGWPYWKRYHQFPLLSICAKHGTPLTAGCNQCKYSQPNARYIKQPKLRCWCGKATQPAYPAFTNEHALSAAQRVGRIVDELLRSPLDFSVTPELVDLAYRQALVASGRTRGTAVAISSLKEQFRAHFTDEFLLSCGSPLTGQRTWLATSLSLRKIPASVIRNALLIDFLFGSLDAFTGELSVARGTLNNPLDDGEIRRTNTCSVERCAEMERRRDRCRGRLKKFLWLSPNTSRTEFQTAFGASARWLREHDAVWYDEVLPRRPKRCGRSKDYRATYLGNMDKSLVVHLKRRFQMLCNEEIRPRRITLRSLLIGHPRANEFQRFKDHLPRTSSLISEVVESKAKYKQRLAVWLATHPAVAPLGVEPIVYARQATGLAVREIALLLNSHPESFVK
jgi:hypothetical protein